MRLGPSVIHSLTVTTTYIDAYGQDKICAIMRAELVAIHVALDKCKKDKWIGIFTDSQTSLQSIQNQLQRPSHTTNNHYKPILAAIVTTLHYIGRLGLPTKLNNIRGNYLADTAAKLVVTSFKDIPEHQKLTIAIGKQAKKQSF